jgi:hypothetical protein
MLLTRLSITTIEDCIRFTITTICINKPHSFFQKQLFSTKKGNVPFNAIDELAAFKKLAKDYGSASDVKIAALLHDKELLEICHDN